jgi:chromosome segregation ATPase
MSDKIYHKMPGTISGEDVKSAPAPREDAAPWDNHCDKLKALEAQLAAEREQCRTAMVASQAEVDALYARAEKAEAKLQMAQLEIDARKQECQTVTHKRDKIEAEVKRLREALEQVALPGVGLANIFEDHPEETIDKYYAAYKYCMRDIERRMTIARAALDGSAKEES